MCKELAIHFTRLYPPYVKWLNQVIRNKSETKISSTEDRNSLEIEHNHAEQSPGEKCPLKQRYQSTRRPGNVWVAEADVRSSIKASGF